MHKRVFNQVFFSPDDGGGADGGAPETQNNQSATTGDQEEQKTFTQADIDMILSKRLAAEKAKFDKHLAETVEKTKTEAQKFAMLTAEERAKAESENALKAHQEKIAEIEHREREITARELKALTMETLAAKGLPNGLLSCVNMADAEACNASVEAIERAFREAVKQGVDEHVKKHGYTPPAGQGASVQAQIKAAMTGQ